MCCIVRAAEIPPVLPSILHKKGRVADFIDNTRHSMETVVTPEGTTALSITKSAKIPSNQALAVVSKQKMMSTDRFHPARGEKVTENVPQKTDLATVYQNKNTRPSQRRQKQRKYPFDGPIYDAKYSEVDDVHQLESPKKKEFGKPPARDARNLGLAKKIKSEPASIAVISKSKEKTKQSLMKRPSKQVTAAEAFDYLVDQFRGKPTNEDQTTPKKNHSLKSNIVRGIKDVNEVCEEIGKNPNLQRIKVQQEADLRHMASAGKRVRGSIIATGANQRYLTAGSLVKQHNFVGKINTTTVAPYISQPKVIPKIIHRKGGDIVRYFTDNGLEISAPQARKILNDSPLTILPIEKPISTAAPAKQYEYTGNTGISHQKRKGNPLGVVQKKQGNPIGEITRRGNPLGTVEKQDIPVGEVQDIYNPIGEITRETTASGLVKRIHRGLGNNKNRGNPVLNNPRFATPSKLVFRHHSGVVGS